MYKNESLYRFFSAIFIKRNLHGLPKVGCEESCSIDEKKKADEEADNLFCGNSKFR